jgi:hypothetical protein
MKWAMLITSTMGTMLGILIMAVLGLTLVRMSN